MNLILFFLTMYLRKRKKEGDQSGNNHTANQYSYSDLSDRDFSGTGTFGQGIGGIYGSDSNLVDRVVWNSCHGLSK